MRAAFLGETSPLFNVDHDHLHHATLGVLWTAVENRRQELAVVGTAERPLFRGNAWQKERQRYQLEQWFGFEPDFLITLSAEYAGNTDDTSWCSLVEHELYHCAQKLDEWGTPKFTRTGEPIWTLRGHDVEEFVAIIERYGPAAGAGSTKRFIEAAQRKPKIGARQVASACGTCRAKVA